jgi:single-stranded-DNA-specific exonuclease
MEPAVDRLLAAIRNREKILIYGDYDVDGTLSVVLLLKAIELAGGSAGYHVPHRLKDGYGMRTDVVEQAAAEGVRLIVSVDTGIRAAAVVERAAELGIDVVVTDHHLPESALPPALAVLNPNRPDCTYPEKDLCGAGVAFKLAQALVARLDWAPAKVQRICASLLKLVAIATVADVVPLTGENRAMVKHGLAGLSDPRNPGLRALFQVAGLTPGVAPTARQVAFQIGPRVNAAGRMDTARQVIELFLTADAGRAETLARGLHEHNAQRQRTEAATLEACLGAPEDQAAAGLVYYGGDWHRGVLGIVASRLVERLAPARIRARPGPGQRHGARLRPQRRRLPSAGGAGIDAGGFRALRRSPLRRRGYARSRARGRVPPALRRLCRHQARARGFPAEPHGGRSRRVARTDGAGRRRRAAPGAFRPRQPGAAVSGGRRGSGCTRRSS